MNMLRDSGHVLVPIVVYLGLVVSITLAVERRGGNAKRWWVLVLLPACGALAGQHSVRGGQSSRRINAMVSANCEPGEPQHPHDWQGHRKQKAPVSQRMRPLEIIEVNTLREFFCCARSWHSHLQS